jgi:hypothetical protein
MVSWGDYCLTTDWTTWMFPLASVSRPALGPTQPLVQRVPEAFLGGKVRPGCDADLSPHLVPRVVNEEELYLLYPMRIHRRCGTALHLLCTWIKWTLIYYDLRHGQRERVRATLCLLICSCLRCSCSRSLVSFRAINKTKKPSGGEICITLASRKGDNWVTAGRNSPAMNHLTSGAHDSGIWLP